MNQHIANAAPRTLTRVGCQVRASAIYDTELRHRRREPAHTIRQRLRLAYLDFDEIPDVMAARRGWSTRRAPVHFRREDYLDGTTRPLHEALGDLVEERTGARPPGPIRMLTQLRTLGWLFNPLTTYYCFEPDGTTLASVVLEITNTPWKQRYWYVLDASQVTGKGTAFEKSFHVSPFLPMDLTYRCRITPPGTRLAVRFELASQGEDGVEQRLFDADLTGRRLVLDAPITASTIARTASQTLRVSAGIYAHAALLRRQGAHFHTHPDRRVDKARAIPNEPRT